MAEKLFSVLKTWPGSLHLPATALQSCYSHTMLTSVEVFPITAAISGRPKETLSGSAIAVSDWYSDRKE